MGPESRGLAKLSGALFAFLNDQSLLLAENQYEAQRRMSIFVRMYQRLTTRILLRTEVEFSTLPLAPDYSLVHWRNDDSVDRDEKTYLRSILTRSPTLADLPQQDEALAQEAILDGASSLSCLSAHLLSGLVLSLDSAARWHSPILTAQITVLDEDLELQEATSQIRHTCLPDHVDHWRDWIQLRLANVNSPEEMWSRRESLYPNLVFFPRVERDLARLTDAQFRQVQTKLADLQREASLWVANGFAPAELLRSTPESNPTMEQYWRERTFTGPTGQRQTFTWHLRYTPDAGRLFYHAEQPGEVWIGYIGPHLPTVRYPT